MPRPPAVKTPTALKFHVSLKGFRPTVLVDDATGDEFLAYPKTTAYYVDRQWYRKSYVIDVLGYKAVDPAWRSRQMNRDDLRQDMRDGIVLEALSPGDAKETFMLVCGITGTDHPWTVEEVTGSSAKAIDTGSIVEKVIARRAEQSAREKKLAEREAEAKKKRRLAALG